MYYTNEFSTYVASVQGSFSFNTHHQVQVRASESCLYWVTTSLAATYAKLNEKYSIDNQD